MKQKTDDKKTIFFSICFLSGKNQIKKIWQSIQKKPVKKWKKPCMK